MLVVREGMFMNTGFLYRKATQSLNYFAIKEGGTINRMKAIKLVWLSERFQLRKFGRLIFNDTYYALKNGSVASNTKNIAYLNEQFLEEDELSYGREFLSHADVHDYSSTRNADLKVFCTSELDAFELIYSEFGKFNQFELSELSHDYPEWKKFESNFTPNNQSKRFPIDYNDFFCNPNSNRHNLFKGLDHQIFIETENFLESSKEYFQNNI